MKKWYVAVVVVFLLFSTSPVAAFGNDRMDKNDSETQRKLKKGDEVLQLITCTQGLGLMVIITLIE